MPAEIKTQQKFINFLKDKLEYKYIGDFHWDKSTNIIEPRLKAFLGTKYSDKIVNAAVYELVKLTEPGAKSIYQTNKEVYNALKYGVQIEDIPGEPKKTVYFLDFEHPTNNDFAVAEEVSIATNSSGTKRPDLVIYVNGIALGVIELKRAAVSVADAIRQNITNQSSRFIPGFFTTVQFCYAANESEGLWYGTTGTPEKFYTTWQDDHFSEHPEDRNSNDAVISEKINNLSNPYDSDLFRQVYSMFDKTRFLDLVENFVVFDLGTKKLVRYNQYFAIKRAQTRLKRGEGGIIWHTQGSGKTLTMVWLTNWILGNNFTDNRRVLIVTDREELDEQIEKTFKGVGLAKIARTKSGRELLNILGNTEKNDAQKNLVCSLVHKFGRKVGEISDKDIERYIKELKNSIPADFEPKGNIFVFVDECHRTQSGKLNAAMKTILPNAVFIGFTGTPRLKKAKERKTDKNKISTDIFGSYIHTYKYDQGVHDKVVLDLLYEARDVEQYLSSKTKIDEWFDIVTKDLTASGKAQLKKSWGTLQKLYSSKERIERIAADIETDFLKKARLADGRGNAILVADSIETACRYYEVFTGNNGGMKNKCAVITSYKPSNNELRTDISDLDIDSATLRKQNAYLKMLGFDPANPPDDENLAKKIGDFEKETKERFINEPGQMKLLIVVDKLLTGFDAPHCTYLYLDKEMRDLNLFQAICRVNRKDDETKDFGYIVDYKNLFNEIKDSVNRYTTNAFDGLEKSDVEGILKNRKIAALDFFEDCYNRVKDDISGVKFPREDKDYYDYFCSSDSLDEQSQEIYYKAREKFYSHISTLGRAFAEAKIYLLDDVPDKVPCYEKEINRLLEVKQSIGRYSGDFLDLAKYEPQMRNLIDRYIRAEDSEPVGEFKDLTLLDFIMESGKVMTSSTTSGSQKNNAAEGIENNLRRKIVEKRTVNPKYFDNMSKILEELIKLRKTEAEEYAKLLEKMIELAKKVEQPEENTERYPEEIRNNATMRAIFDFTEGDIELTKELHNAFISNRQDGFQFDNVKKSYIIAAFDQILNNEDEVDELFDLICRQEEYTAKNAN